MTDGTAWRCSWHGICNMTLWLSSKSVRYKTRRTSERSLRVHTLSEPLPFQHAQRSDYPSRRQAIIPSLVHISSHRPITRFIIIIVSHQSLPSPLLLPSKLNTTLPLHPRHLLLRNQNAPGHENNNLRDRKFVRGAFVELNLFPRHKIP